MTSIIQGLNVSKCTYIFQYSLYKSCLYAWRHVRFYGRWLSWQRLHSLSDSLQTTLHCHSDTWFVTCSLWICHYELLYIYGINDVWILNLARLSVRPSVRPWTLPCPHHMIARHRFELESPNLHQKCIIMVYYRLVLKIGVIDLDLQCDFGHFNSELVIDLS